MTADEARKKVLDLARGEIGYRETCDNRTKYAREYDWDTRLYGFDMDGLPWCDWFVDWLFIKAFGFGTGTAMTYQHTGCSGASCACSASYYRENGAFYDGPEPGDQIFFYADGGINHTGIVEEVSGDTVVTIEGNSSDMVKRNRYRKDDTRIAGYGRPAWGMVSEYPAADDPESGEPVRDTGLEEDGIAGPATWAALAVRMPVCLRGSRNRAVAALQSALDQLGAGLDADGEFGPLTEEAVRLFQGGRI